jgi:hypothetical protein
METTMTNWLDAEIDALSVANENANTYPESLKLVENKITEVDIDFSKPFEKRPNKLNPTTMQVLIPCSVAGKAYTFWLNVQNPLYHELIKKGKSGTTKFKILRTGKQKDTRYSLIE